MITQRSTVVFSIGVPVRPMGDTQDDVGELQRLISSNATEGVTDPIASAMQAMFARGQMELPKTEADGSIRLP
jgi:hypothetical protein